MSETVVNRVAKAIYQRRNPGRNFSDETALVQEGYRTDAAAALTAADCLIADDKAEKDTRRKRAVSCMNPACESQGTVKIQVFGKDVGLACDVCAQGLDATKMREALPDFDAADAALNAAMTEQNARLEAEEKIANVQSWLDQVLAEYDFSKGIFGEHSWRYSAGVLADLLHHVLHSRIGGYEPVLPEVDDDATP